MLTTAVLDSLGNTLYEQKTGQGSHVTVPAASLGGTDGRTVSLTEDSALETIVEDLASQQLRFALRTTVHTIGGDADDSDNLQIRTFDEWISPQIDTVSLSFTVPHSGDQTSVTVAWDTLTQAPGLTLGPLMRAAEPVRQGSTFRYILPVGASTGMQHGSKAALRLTMFHATTGKALYVRDHVAVFDTVPPMISNMRIVVLRDGRLAISLYAGDKDSGVPFNGVISHYSIDSGRTWSTTAHRHVVDDFGRAALFEAVIGPFPKAAKVILRVSARDMVGNAMQRIPEDVFVTLAPAGAEHLLDSKLFAWPNGSALHALSRIADRKAWVEYALRRRGPAATASDTVFEQRRISELRELPARLDSLGVDASAFSPANVTLVRAERPAPEEGRGSMLVISLPQGKR